jgi:hypothetical protein
MAFLINGWQTNSQFHHAVKPRRRIRNVILGYGARSRSHLPPRERAEGKRLGSGRLTWTDCWGLPPNGAAQS